MNEFFTQFTIGDILLLVIGWLLVVACIIAVVGVGGDANDNLD